VEPEPRFTRHQRTCTAPDCRRKFVPTRANSRYCSTRCKNRETHRKFKNKDRVQELIAGLRRDLLRLSQALAGEQQAVTQ
jgi:hypothetical protein